MAPKDTFLALAMVFFILCFNLNWVGLVISDYVQGHQFLSEMRKESENKELFFTFVNMMSVFEKTFHQKLKCTTNCDVIHKYYYHLWGTIQ